LLDPASPSQPESGGPGHGPPHPPDARKRPGSAVALLDPASPSQPESGGPGHGPPHPPDARKRPGSAVALLDPASPSQPESGGPGHGPPRPPHARKRPGSAVALLDRALSRALRLLRFVLRPVGRLLNRRPAGPMAPPTPLDTVLAGDDSPGNLARLLIGRDTAGRQAAVARYLE